MNYILRLNRLLKKSGLLALLFVFLTTYHAFGTHLRAGEIIVKNLGGVGLTFSITVIVYTNTSETNVLFGGDGAGIDFGDGSFHLVPYVENEIRLDLDPTGSIATASYTTLHTYTGFSNYTISYVEANRNAGVLNMLNSVDTPFYIETSINIDPLYGYNSSPQFLVPPIDRGCVGQAWSHNPGAFDPDVLTNNSSDSLAYELVVPFMSRNLMVNGYRSPASADFGGTSENGGTPTFKINSRTGTILWDAPGTVGEYNIAFIVKELRNIRGVWRELSRVRRDMQIIIDDCEDYRPDLKVPNDTCVVAGTILKANIIGFDSPKDVPPDDVKIQAFSDIFELASAQSPAKVDPAVPAFRPSPSTLKFEWNTNCGHVKDQPYQVVFKVTDKASDARLATFKTWFITVVGPAPKWKDAQLDLPTRSAHLEWKPYQCLNAEKMQVWRRIDDSNYVPGNCETGMPESLGYTLLDVISIKDPSNEPVTNYIDKGLKAGTKYCYRLVAVYPQSKGSAKSYVSLDTCIAPFKTQEPIITKVSVDSTDIVMGQISVGWHVPLVGPIGSYTYQVYRGAGFSGAPGAVPVYTGNLTSFVDTNLNTKENVYNYRVVAFDTGDLAFRDTSSVASSVRLETKSQIKKIELNWSAEVPWSLQSQDYPTHAIFRGPEGSKGITDMDSIGVAYITTDGLRFVDSGEFGNTPLVDDSTYCYVIKTYGTYGNDDAPELNGLINYSQKRCAQTGDSIPPCKLLPPIKSTAKYSDCTDYIAKFGCDNDEYINILTWNRPDNEACRNDISGYKIFSASSIDGTYVELKTKPNPVRDTVYSDTLRSSFKRCYKIAAVDNSNNMGELSEPMCIDNCPYYELPNVFTPNGDNCNDTFSAYRNTNSQGEIGKCHALLDNKLRCPRFVQSVVCHIYNRWGKEVFSYTGKISDESNSSIYIDWDGRDNAGVDLATAVYYYSVEVTFDVIDPSDKIKVYKGWVHLVR